MRIFAAKSARNLNSNVKSLGYDKQNKRWTQNLPSYAPAVRQIAWPEVAMPSDSAPRFFERHSFLERLRELPSAVRKMAEEVAIERQIDSEKHQLTAADDNFKLLDDFFLEALIEGSRVSRDRTPALGPKAMLPQKPRALDRLPSRWPKPIENYSRRASPSHPPLRRLHRVPSRSWLAWSATTIHRC